MSTKGCVWRWSTYTWNYISSATMMPGYTLKGSVTIFPLTGLNAQTRGISSHKWHFCPNKWTCQPNTTSMISMHMLYAPQTVHHHQRPTLSVSPAAHATFIEIKTYHDTFRYLLSFFRENLGSTPNFFAIIFIASSLIILSGSYNLPMMGSWADMRYCLVWSYHHVEDENMTFETAISQWTWRAYHC